MTSEARELSVDQGAPIELYVFTVNGVDYRYTSSANDDTHLSTTYRAIQGGIVRTEIEETTELPRSNITLRVAGNFEMTNFYRGQPPSDVILLQIFRKHRGETDAIPWWNGRVLNCSWSGEQAELTCESVYTSLRRNGLQRLYQRSCPYQLYSQGIGQCNANKNAFAVPAVVDGISGLTLEASEFGSYPDGRLAGGYLEWEITPTHVEKRGIKTHIGSTVELTSAIPNIAPGIHITAYPGCRHTVSDCNDFFNNRLNFGGFPYIPQKNPFGGNSVY